MPDININIGQSGLKQLLRQQITNNFLLEKHEVAPLFSLLPAALQRTAICFLASDNKYYASDDNTANFNPYHSGQYTIFLYFLSNELYLNREHTLADKVYFLNKTLNCLDLFYQIELPEVFFLDHPVGSVLGRAKYGNYFTFQQNCTVGGNHGIYPHLGENVRLFAGATVIGNSTLGNNVFVSAGAYIKDQDIPDNTIVFGSSPNLTLISKPTEYFLKSSPFKIHREA
ncbi:hypothetical protein Rhal01_01663 [Rubritalea halochordaticola]|uniref:Transferase n=1 Tax=Rubritalea halochordaticola TaxID=714537 RepID=A0ABP9UYF3_9BACT